jgi:hypothetical protein
MLEQILVSKTLRADSTAVWRAISEIGGLQRWFPIISDCMVSGSGVGTTRTMYLVDNGGVMRDLIEEINHSSQLLRYQRFESPFPVQSYRGEVRVQADPENRAKISWLVEIDVEAKDRDALRDLIASALAAGIDGLERELLCLT